MGELRTNGEDEFNDTFTNVVGKGSIYGEERLLSTDDPRDIKLFISNLISQEKEKWVEEIKKLKKDKDILYIPSPDVKGMDVSVHYNKALQDCLSLLQNK